MVWTDKIENRYWWHQTKGEFDQLICELEKAEDEEGVSLYVLEMHQKSEADFSCFGKETEFEIRRLLTHLIKETEKHKNLLSEIADELKALKEKYAK